MHRASADVVVERRESVIKAGPKEGGGNLPKPNNKKARFSAGLINVSKRDPWWLGTESNRRHADFQSAALPTELPSRLRKFGTIQRLKLFCKCRRKHFCLRSLEQGPRAFGIRLLRMASENLTSAEHFLSFSKCFRSYNPCSMEKTIKFCLPEPLPAETKHG